MSIQAGNNLPKFYSQVRRQGGGTIDQIDYPVAASQTIDKGDWLKLSSGKVTHAITKSGSANTAVANGASPGLIGIALASITTDSNGLATDGSGRTTIPIGLFNDDTEVMVGIYHATPASATQSSVITGTNYEVGIVTGPTTATWTYNMMTTTTNACVNLQEKSIESSPTETYGFVWVKPIGTGRVGA